jgi:CMP-N-acetylneuraminic acid synthetase
MSILALILARGGSKSIPRKNVILVGGKPLIAWSIIAARRVKPSLRVIVSTDDSEIASVSCQWGAETPFIRSSELARDDTPSMDAILHALRWLEEMESYIPDYLVLLQATSPLRSSEDITAAIDLAYERDADAVVSVTPCKEHPYLLKKLDAEGRLFPYVELENPITRRQELPPLFMLNGAIYLAKPEVLINQKSWYTSKTYAYIMPEDRSLDIDSPWQLTLADLVLRNRSNE